MISHHLFTQAPPLMAALLASSILFNLATSHVLPRKTPSLELQHSMVTHSLPTPASLPQPSPLRSDTICGYIGGNPDLPATCLAGSYCAVDVEHGAIGCCPDEGPCNRGIFTGCVDGNSGPQTMADPYIFTCSGPNVCYKNQFAGGYFQYGCGTASGLATTVLPSASGRPALTLTSISVQFTATPTHLLPSTMSMSHGHESTETPGASSTHSTSSMDPTVPEMSQPSEPSTTNGGDAPSSQGSSSHNSGAIIGGTVGGIAFVFTVGLLAFLLWRRRSNGNGGRGSADTQEPKNARSMEPGHTHFEPYTMRQGVAAGTRPPAAAPPFNRSSDGVSTESGVFGNILHQPRHLDTVKEAAGSRAGNHGQESDCVPLTGRVDEFPYRFNSAADGMDTDSDADTQHSGTYSGPRRGDGSGVLWQQNRRKSRNLVWM